MNLPDLDLRHLTAPEPLLRALAAADALGVGDSVAVLTPMLPVLPSPTPATRLQTIRRRGSRAGATRRAVVTGGS